MLGVLFEIVWLLPSLMSIMISDSGTNTMNEFGIGLIILGPIVAVLTFATTTVVFLALKRRAKIVGILTFVVPVLVVIMGAALSFSGQ